MIDYHTHVGEERHYGEEFLAEGVKMRGGPALKTTLDGHYRAMAGVSHARYRAGLPQPPPRLRGAQQLRRGVLPPRPREADRLRLRRSTRPRRPRGAHSVRARPGPPRPQDQPHLPGLRPHGRAHAAALPLLRGPRRTDPHPSWDHLPAAGAAEVGAPRAGRAGRPGLPRAAHHHRPSGPPLGGRDDQRDPQARPRLQRRVGAVLPPPGSSTIR